MGEEIIKLMMMMECRDAVDDGMFHKDSLVGAFSDIVFVVVSKTDSLRKEGIFNVAKKLSSTEMQRKATTRLLCERRQ